MTPNVWGLLVEKSTNNERNLKNRIQLLYDSIGFEVQDSPFVLKVVTK